jgi:hypothetical protein
MREVIDEGPMREECIERAARYLELLKRHSELEPREVLSFTGVKDFGPPSDAEHIEVSSSWTWELPTDVVVCVEVESGIHRLDAVRVLRKIAYDLESSRWPEISTRDPCESLNPMFPPL